MAITNTPKPLIMTGDISNLHPYVESQIGSEYGHHRSLWMESKLKNIISFFHKSLGKKYTSLIITATEIGALEAILQNIVLENDLVLTNKESVWETIAKKLGASTQDINSREIGKDKKNRPIIICLDDVFGNGKKTNLINIKNLRDKYPDALIVVNMSTSFGADDINFAKIDADVYVTVPERALASIPGLTIIATNKRFLEKINNVRGKMYQKPYTFDLLKYYTSWKKYSTPYSPDVSASVGLSSSIQLLNGSGGISGQISRHKTWASNIRKQFSKYGITTIAPQKTLTNAFTIFDLPKALEAKNLVKEFGTKHCITILEQENRKNSIKVGHVGYLSKQDILRFFTAFEEIASRYIKIKKAPIEISSDTWSEVGGKSPFPSKFFSISEKEFKEQTFQKASESKNKEVERILKNSANILFNEENSLDAYCFKERTVGFIGAGNTVKETILRCKQMGIGNLMVYSPSLSKQKKGDSTLKYWKEKNVIIAKSAKEVFMKSHTVVLLPTLHTRESINLLRKSKEYLNTKMVNSELLKEIEAGGIMDLLINASAREELIDRKALKQHLDKGWLSFSSDEFPKDSDPILEVESVLMAGHIGGSSESTKKSVAKNTKKILDQVIYQIINGKKQDKKSAYTVNLMNRHLKPASGWRFEFNSSKSKPSKRKIRILLADAFDLKTLDFVGLEKKLKCKIETIDISKQKHSESSLIRSIKAHEPHIVMIRTKTIITKNVALAMKDVSDFCAVIRPGVGIDNIYAGMSLLSKAGIQIINEPFGNSFSVGELTTRLIVKGTPKVILTPGPTKYNPEVFNSVKDYCHCYSTKFVESYESLNKKLKPWINLKHGPIILSTPSTGFMEAAITNLTSEDEFGLVIAHGKFGNRFKEICESKNREVITLGLSDRDWGKVFSINEIRKAFEIESKKKNSKKISFMCFQQNETSSAVSYQQKHLGQIVEIARKYNPNIIIILDVVSGAFSHNLNFEKLDIDALVLGSQKGLGVSSGITYATLSDRALKKMLKYSQFNGSWNEFIKNRNNESFLSKFEEEKKIYYLNFLRLLTNKENGKFISTPSVFHILSTLASLSIMEREGRDNVVKRSERLARISRASTLNMGLKLLSDTKFLSNSVTPVIIPKNLNASEVRKDMDKYYGIFVSGAQSDHLKPSLIRIGHIGYVYDKDIVRCFRALRIATRKK